MKLCTSAYQICTHLHLDECVKFLSLTLPDPKWNMCLSSSSHTTVKNSKNFNSPFPQIELWSILSAVYYGTIFRSCEWSYWGLRSVFSISVFSIPVFSISVFRSRKWSYWGSEVSAKSQDWTITKQVGRSGPELTSLWVYLPQTTNERPT